MSDEENNSLLPQLLGLPKTEFERIRKLVLVTLVLVIGFMCPIAVFVLNQFLTPDFFESKFHLSAKVEEKLRAEMVRDIDSGYSATFVFRPGDVDNDNDLLFYAEDDQDVSIIVDAKTSPAEDTRLQIFRDGLLWAQGDGNCHTRGKNKSKLKSDSDRGELHDLRVVVAPLKKGHRPVVVKTLVLVSNPIHPGK